MALNDVWKLVIKQAYENQLNLNVLHYLETGLAGTGATAAQRLNGLMTEIEPDLVAMQNNNWTYTGATLQRIFPTVTDPIEISETPPAAGDVVGDGLPAYVASVISWRTAIATRRTRGRSFFGGRSESDTEESFLNAGAITLHDTLALTLIGPISTGVGGNTSELTLCVWSPTTPGATVVSNHLTRSQVRTMRTRTVGRGV
jgi:hypothetical protein